MPTYSCTLCDFTTQLKSNYTCHLVSKKHIRFTQLENNRKIVDTPETTISNEKKTKEFTCKFCEQQFSFRQSMNRHMKYTCTKNKDELKELVNKINIKMEQQNNYFKTQLQSQKQEFEAHTNKIDRLLHFLEVQHEFL
jgi:hypothetical protein